MMAFFTAGWTSGIVGLAMKGLGVARVLGGDSATADFTGDGIPDIILTLCQNVTGGPTVNGPSPSRFLLLKGKGDGSFVDGSTLLSGGGKITPGCVRHLAVGDFNGDGVPDFVTASNYEDGRSIPDGSAIAAPQTAYLSNNGKLVRKAIGLTTWAHALSVGDWNNDGRDDILIGGFTPHPGETTGTAVFVQKNGGALARRFLSVDGGVSAIADLDGNGVSEVAEYAYSSTDSNQSGIKVTSIQADGSLGSAQFYPEPYDRIEACTGYNGDPGQCIITHDAQGEYIDGGINGFVVGDVNHDGRDDILNDRGRIKMVYVGGMLDLRGAPASTVLQVRTLGPGGVLPIPGTRITGWSAPTFVPYFRLVDFNGDGHLDIFAPTGELDGHVNQILLNDGVGNFKGIPGPHIPQITPYPAWHNYFIAEPIDANGDGIMDIVLRLNWFEPANFPELPSASAVTYLATKRFFTGHAYANPALRAVPGFNEDYYLNAYPTVRTLIAQHTYTDALDHYLKAGRAQNWRPFALNTTVFGSDGPDVVRLRNGNETAVGSPGRDIYSGFGGADTFVFNQATDTGKTAQTRDVLTDFVTQVDRIDLQRVDANALAAGNQAFKFLPVRNTKFHNVAGELRWLQEDPTGSANDKTIVEGDTNGDALPDLQIELRGLISLVAGDFRV